MGFEPITEYILCCTVYLVSVNDKNDEDKVQQYEYHAEMLQFVIFEKKNSISYRNYC